MRARDRVGFDAVVGCHRRPRVGVGAFHRGRVIHLLRFAGQRLGCLDGGVRVRGDRLGLALGGRDCRGIIRLVDLRLVGAVLAGLGIHGSGKGGGRE